MTSQEELDELEKFRRLADNLPRWHSRDGVESDQIAAIYLRTAADKIESLIAEVERLRGALGLIANARERGVGFMVQLALMGLDSHDTRGVTKHGANK